MEKWKKRFCKSPREKKKPETHYKPDFLNYSLEIHETGLAYETERYFL